MFLSADLKNKKDFQPLSLFAPHQTQTSFPLPQSSGTRRGIYSPQHSRRKAKGTHPFSMQETPESSPKSTMGRWAPLPHTTALRAGSFGFYLVQSCKKKKKSNILLLQWIFYWQRGCETAPNPWMPEENLDKQAKPNSGIIPLFTNHNAKCLINKASMEQVRSGKWEIGNCVHHRHPQLCHSWFCRAREKSRTLISISQSWSHFWVAPHSCGVVFNNPVHIFAWQKPETLYWLGNIWIPLLNWFFFSSAKMSTLITRFHVQFKDRLDSLNVSPNLHRICFTGK